MAINALRTPEDRFSVLPAFSYQPNYVDDLDGYETLRMAYIDEGDKNAETTFLCLHGEPSWSYLYRKMIPVFTAAGHRVIAPDLYGFGRSDKPVDEETYTFEFHRNSLLRLVERLDLTNITLVCQDWGGILGLTLPMEMASRFTRLLVMNTGLPAGDGATEGFYRWRGFCASVPEIPVGGLIATDAGSAVNMLDVVAYDAPYPDNRYKAGVRRFPQLVPVDPDMPGIDLTTRARAFWSNEWQGQSFMAVGMKDAVLGEKSMEVLRSFIKGCPPPMKLEQAGHFVQEYGEEIAKQALIEFGL
ncbi:alpha/beta fold hydrolase [Thalassotalea euphylliae]|uniref:Alpha/beta fold hydrolase n=1 Tax=Thalassotalea euphylliae TaxID=1655234 RepID=A0A3E0TRJ6_9GAMM|nr:haloalkane dehalogenase [Thalassotalea euphylliae]REL27124.1 alpha/beta fold hydrolase [Thalassotalea euphylliae]